MSEVTDKLPRILLSNLRKSPYEDLAAELSNLIGYDALSKHVADNHLAFVLEEAEIQPYDNIAVKAYMKNQLAKMQEENSVGMRWVTSGSRRMRVATDIRWVWKKESLEIYRLPVPASALHLVVKVAKLAKKHKVEAKFVVHSLMSHEVVADPFLSVTSAGSQEFFLAVWDEPTFVG